MTMPFNIEQRKPIWIALSAFYLDTELQESDFKNIAIIILDSPYTFEEVRKINKYEVFPVLQLNLLSMAGEWVGFDEEQLVKIITDRLNKKNKLRDAGVEVSYQLFKWMCAKYWRNLERVYN